MTATVPAGRRIRVSGSAYYTNSGTSGSDILKIHQDGVQVNERAQPADVDAHAVECVAILSPSAGTHTWKLRAVATGGTATSNASATFPAFILVEDITGAVWPVGSTVTAGMVASEAWTTWVPALVNLTIGNGTIEARYSKIGRTVDWEVVITLGSTSTVGTDVHFLLPVAARPSASTRLVVGSVLFEDANGGNVFGQMWINNSLPDRARFLYGALSGSVMIATAISATAPFTWASTDRLTCTGSYEAAS